jgi:hypothetical protein
MIDKDQLPEDPADWGDLEVSLPRLDPDSAESCPASLASILEYVDIESADAGDVDAGRLQFVRTAEVGDQQCWIWSYIDSDGELSYVTYWVASDGERTLGMSDAAPEVGGPALSPEQYMLAEYHDLIYW